MPANPKLKLRLGDKVVVISGKDKGQVGKILKLDKKKMRAIVENVHMQSKHQKSRQNDKPGQIIKQEGPVHYSNIMLFNPASEKGERVGYKVNGDGSKVRIFKKSNTEV